MRRVLVATACVALAWLPTHAQEFYARGQNVVPVYEGWEKNDDGSFNLTGAMGDYTVWLQFDER